MSVEYVMKTVFVLVHSPLVGPLTWSLVANRLRARGLEVAVPSLPNIPLAGEPFWKRYASAVAKELESISTSRDLILVGHSGAGALLPAIRQMTRHPVRSYIFVDADIPENGRSRLDLLELESAAIAQELRQMLKRGERYPTWSDDDLREIVPDATLRQAILQELRPQSLAFFEEPIPVFTTWPDAPCGYMRLSAGYNRASAKAREEGWGYIEFDAGHFHMLVDPGTVGDALMEMAERMGILSNPRTRSQTRR